MKPVPKAGPVYVLLGVALLSATFGCVDIARYRQMSITVHDDSAGLPVAHAHVTIQSGVPEMKWNTGKIPVFQFGATDAKGEWKVTYYTKHNGACGVQCPGYKDKVLTRMALIFA